MRWAWLAFGVLLGAWNYTPGTCTDRQGSDCRNNSHWDIAGAVWDDGVTHWGN